MKKNILVGLLVTMPHGALIHADMNQHIVFEQVTIISKLDGITGFIDTVAIHNMLKVKQRIVDIQYGVFNPETKSRTGKYLFQDKLLGIKALVLKEQAIEKELEKNNVTIDSVYQNMSKAPADLAPVIAELKEAFNKAKEDFKQATFSLIDSIKYVKPLIEKLMEESCSKRNIKNSVILKWTEANGNEEILYHQTIRTISIFNDFLTHLNYFLGDMLHNCPKAFEQYKKAREQQAHAHA